MTDRTLLPEIRSILQRAASNRFLLDQLLDQVPAERWDNRVEGGQWSARIHLAHLATIDTVTLELLEQPGRGGFWLDENILDRRTTLLAGVATASAGDLRGLMRRSRSSLSAHLAAFDEGRLAASVVIETPGAYPPRQSMSLRAYLAAWAEHDVEHTLAIREAITAPLQPSALTAAQRIRWLGSS